MEYKRLEFEDVVLLVMDVQALAETDPVAGPLVQLIKACRAMGVPELWVEHCPSKIGGTSIAAVRHALEEAEAVGPIAKTTFSAVDCVEFCRQLLRIVLAKKTSTTIDERAVAVSSATNPTLGLFLFSPFFSKAVHTPHDVVSRNGTEELHEALRSVSEGITVLISGSENHVCVYQTTLCLRALGFGVQIVADATTARAQLYRDVGNARCVELGARLTTGEMVMLEMLRDCRDPRWRLLFKVFKECTQSTGTTPTAPAPTPSPAPTHQ